MRSFKIVGLKLYGAFRKCPPHLTVSVSNSSTENHDCSFNFSFGGWLAVFHAVPPAYYAHLAAFRARFYMEPEMQENGSSGVGSGHGSKGTRVGESGVRPLPALKENVKRVMFYCWRARRVAGEAITKISLVYVKGYTECMSADLPF